jgi:hypothetical protein
MYCSFFIRTRASIHLARHEECFVALIAGAAGKSPFARREEEEEK